MKRADESFLVFRGLPEGEVLEILVNWKDWCASLTQALIADGGPAFAPEGKIAARDNGFSGGSFDEPELPFLALPYAVRVGAR